MAPVNTKFEINCDMGEGFGKWKMGPDEELMPYIDVSNIACGYHAGDHSTMRRVVKLAKKHNVRICAHPGLPDKMGFGRRFMAISPEEVYDLIVYQVGALQAFCRAEGVEVEFLAPHGQLYFYIRSDEKIFQALIRAAKDLGNLILSNVGSSAYTEKVESHGLQVYDKFFADIDWDESGKLASFQHWSKKTPEQIYERVKRAGLEGKVECWDGKDLNLDYDGKPFSLTLHSDFPEIMENVKQARKALDELNDHYGYK